jgi:enoyl-CoA hydratase/carnithine racemase
MGYEQILYEIRDGVAVITLNRPEVLNAWTPQMGREMSDALEKSNKNDEVGAIVVTGAGRGFCSGADLRWFDQITRELQKAKDPAAVSRKFRDEGHLWIHNLIKLALESKPVIGAINGPAIGVGLTMTLPWDIRLASDNARFNMAFVRMGLVPEAGSTFFFSRLVGFSKACELVYSARFFDAKEALELGLVSRVLSPEKLISTALDVARDCGERPPMALRLAKELMVKGAFFHGLEEALSLEEESFGRCQASLEHREAVQAFMEKRKPDFKKLRRAHPMS